MKIMSMLVAAAAAIGLPIPSTPSVQPDESRCDPSPTLGALEAIHSSMLRPKQLTRGKWRRDPSTRPAFPRKWSRLGPGLRGLLGYNHNPSTHCQ